MSNSSYWDNVTRGRVGRRRLLKSGAALSVGAAALALILQCGMLNGILVARIKVNPLITTLGTMGIFRGIALLAGGTDLRLPGEVETWAYKNYWGLYLFLAVALVFH